MPKKRRPPIPNSRVLDILRFEGYPAASFRMDYNDITGYYIPYDIFTEHVAKFTSKLKRGMRVKLNTESTRKITRVHNQKDVRAMVTSLGVGNGNTYQYEKDPSLDDPEVHYLRPDRYINKIRIGSTFYPNVLAAFHKARTLRNQGIRIIVGPTSWWHRQDFESITNLVELKRELNKPDPIVEVRAPNARDYLKQVELENAGVFRGIDQPYGTIIQHLVHFESYWFNKREARFIVQFDHGARAMLTSDWITRCHSIEYAEDARLLQCTHAGQSPECAHCAHTVAHTQLLECQYNCNHIKEGTCQVIQDYRRDNVRSVYRGYEYRRPERESIEIRIQKDHERLQKQLAYAKDVLHHPAPCTTTQMRYTIDNLIVNTGGRV